MVVVAVLGMVLAVAAPNMADMIRGATVRAVSEGVQTGLHKARAEALKRNQVVTFWLVSPADATALDASCALASNSASWVVSQDNPAGKCGVDPSATTDPRIVDRLGAGSTAGSLTVEAANAAGNAATSVSFNGFGQTVNTGSQIVRIDIQHTDATARRLRIQVSTSGAIRLCDRDVASGDPRACI